MNPSKPPDQTPAHPATPDELMGNTSRALLNATNELIVVTDTEGNILVANNRFARLCAPDGQDLAGSSIYTALPAGLQNHAREMIAAILDNGRPLRREGETNGLWYELGIYSIPGGRGRSPRIAFIIRDITNEHRHEEIILDSERRYRQIVDIANEGICVTDKEFRFTLFNRQAQIMFGISQEEALGQTFDIFIYPEDLEDHRLQMQQRMQGLPGRYERRFRRMDGTPLWAIVSASPIHGNNGFSGSMSLLTDISQRKLVEEAVKESEERYRTAIEHCNDGVAMLRGDTLTYVNDTFVEMFGYDSTEELIGKDQAITVHPDERHTVTMINRERQRGNKNVPERYEFKGIRKDGATIDVEVSATQTQYRGEAVTLAYLRDITARKHMENELLNVRKLESIGLLAGGIAHDFNNLLMSMLGNISLAKLYLQSSDTKAKDKLIEAEKTVDRARELTTQLLTFSKGGSPVKKPLNLQPVIVEASRISLSGSRIACDYNFQEDLWKVKADEAQLRQVVYQLTRNAVEAMPQGGSLTISGRNATIDDQQEGILPAGRYVVVSVTDTGTGITKEHLSQVFDPYFTTKDFGPQKGMGLGLAVCFSIIKKHGGQIDVGSEVNKGTTFTIYLRAYEPEPRTASQPVPAIESGSQKERLKILIADDERSILQTTTMLLQHLGHNVVGTLNGVDAIGIYRRSMESGEPFDVVILDLVSPGGPDGVKILREILNIDPEVCAILSSGYPDDPQIINHKEHGFKGVLLKPYRIEDLNSALRSVRDRESA